MKGQLYFRLTCAMLLALVFSILPLPQFLSAFRPPWVMLFVLYLQYYLPNQFKLLMVLFLGLLLDVLLSTVLGEHSLALLLITWLASTKARRFHFFS